MFSKIAIFAVATFAAFVAALPSPGGVEHGSNTQVCGTGPVQCCNSVQDANSDVIKSLFGLLHLDVLAAVTGQVGLSCSPVADILGGNSCTAQTVCCQNNQFNGLVVVGCTPINLNL